MIYIQDDIMLNGEFPFDIYDGQGQSDMLSDDSWIHKHDCMEINYIISGSGYYVFDNRQFEVQPGDVCIINNQEYHMAYGTCEFRMKVLVFQADMVWNGNSIDYGFLKPFFERSKSVPPFLRVDSSNASSIVSLLMEMEKEWKEKNTGYRLFIKADLLKVLGMIYRKYEELNHFEKNNFWFRYNFNAIIRVVDYINSHFHEPLSLKNMADMANMSESYFSSMFRKNMKMSFSSYVLEKRLGQVCILLKTSDEPISDIAALAGFDSISYFNRAFKRKYNMSPSEYRKFND